MTAADQLSQMALPPDCGPGDASSRRSISFSSTPISEKIEYGKENKRASPPKEAAGEY
jgi:hypothetical protein